ALVALDDRTEPYEVENGLGVGLREFRELFGKYLLLGFRDEELRAVGLLELPRLGDLSVRREIVDGAVQLDEQGLDVLFRVVDVALDVLLGDPIDDLRDPLGIGPAEADLEDAGISARNGTDHL